jgi:hypothetical protein
MYGTGCSMSASTVITVDAIYGFLLVDPDGPIMWTGRSCSENMIGIRD